MTDFYNSVLFGYSLFPAILPVGFYFDAPFGRFSQGNVTGSINGKSPASAPILLWLTLSSGRLGWIVMEIVSPITFLLSASAGQDGLSITNIRRLPLPSRILASLWVLHYTNRALISPIRAPSRSPTHISVVGSAIAFNLVNGYLNGTYLASLDPTAHFSWIYWLGVGLFAAGAAGNILHDEVLLRLRTLPAASPLSSKQEAHAYHIPHGGLYSLISYPNYLCEWIEWFGYALATSALSGSFGRTPPWLFFAAEIASMLPRAVRGHSWYKRKFGKEYPAERKAIGPLLL